MAQLKWFGNKITEKIDLRVIEALQKSAIILQVAIQENTPVITGRLRSSIQPTNIIDKRGHIYSTKVITNVKYAAKVEFGNETRAPRAMFRKGIEESTSLIRDELYNSLKKIK